MVGGSVKQVISSKNDILSNICTEDVDYVETAEELLSKHEDDQLVLTIVSVENLHIHWVITSSVVDTNSNDLMEMNWRG